MAPDARLRRAGRLITGDAPARRSSAPYADCIETAAGNPLYVWSHMGFQCSSASRMRSRRRRPTASSTARTITSGRALSPRKLMAQSRVELAATTDDPADSLEYHRLIAQDKDFSVRVVPSFRTDAALNIVARRLPRHLARAFRTPAALRSNRSMTSKGALRAARFLLCERLPRQRHRHRGISKAGRRLLRRRDLPTGARRRKRRRGRIPRFPL